MELIFKDQIIQYKELPSVEEIIQKINELLIDNYYYSHFIVDGQVVYEDPEQYLLEELSAISKLEVIGRTAAEFTNDILLTAEEYLKRAKPEMTDLAEGFYQNPGTEHWTNFSDMLEGIQWLNQIILSIDGINEQPGNWNAYLNLAAKLEMELGNLEEAVENSDYVLIADIIQYELIPLYESLINEINTTIDTEGTRNDVN